MNENTQHGAFWRHRLVRIAVSSLVGIICIVTVAAGVIYVLSLWMSGSSQCEELAILLCAFFAMFLVAVLSVSIEITVTSLLLYRFHINRPVALVFLANFMAFVVCLLLYMYAPILTEVFWVSAGVVFVASFVLCDWLVNNPRGSVRIRVILTITILVVSTILGFVIHSGPNEVDRTQLDQEIRQSIAGSHMTILVPRPHSSVPQPETISFGSTDEEAVAIGLDAGPGRDFTLSEYIYTGANEPTKDCHHIYAGAEKIEDCSLAMVMPSGTKIYKGSRYSDAYFVVKHGTVVFISASSGENESKGIYAVLDSLEPLQTDTFLQTLRSTNPQEY